MNSRAILSAQNGNVHMRHDLPRFIRMMEDGWLDTRRRSSPTATRSSQVNDALNASAEKRDLSGVIVPELAAAGAEDDEVGRGKPHDVAVTVALEQLDELAVQALGLVRLERLDPGLERTCSVDVSSHISSPDRPVKAESPSSNSSSNASPSIDST